MGTSQNICKTSWLVATQITALSVWWLITHPYEGIRHDSILYHAQAYIQLDPELYSADLFFKYGSQADHTLFGPLYAHAVSALGAGHAGLIFTLAGLLFFFAALAILARRFCKSQWPWAVLLFTAGSGLYGGLSALRVAEPFVTARPYAEAVVLLAMAGLMTGRFMAATTALILSSLLHPLQSLGGWLAWFISLQRDKHNTLITSAGLVALLLLAAIPLKPFDSLLHSFDPEWLHAVRENNPMVFISQWSVMDALLWGTNALCLGLAVIYLEGAARRLAISVMLAGGMGLLLSVLAELSSNVLLTGLQPWRVLWLLHVFAVLGLPTIIIGAWRQGEAGKLAAALLLYAMALRGLPTAAIALLLGAMLLVTSRRGFTVGPYLRWLGWGGLALAAMTQTAQSTQSFLLVALEQYDRSWSELAARVLAKPFIVLAVGAALLWALQAPGARMRVFGVLGAILLGTLAVTTWDQRHPWARHVEETAWGAHPFARHIPREASVLWHEDTLACWHLLGRRCYVTGYQGAGLVFNRGTAEEFLRRREAVAVLGLQQDICELMNALNRRNESCVPNLDALAETCRRAPDLGYIVLPAHYPGYALARDVFNDVRLHRPIEHSLYDCSHLRELPISLATTDNVSPNRQ